jgi:1-acyl-sn-glycerol-3-phosphate acyltransferase
MSLTLLTARPETELAPVALPRRSAVFYRWFTWWVRGYLARHFHAVRLARGTWPTVDPDVPLVVVLNHPSWWDPLVGSVLAGRFPERVHYAPIDAAALARYSLFTRLGFTSVTVEFTNP